MEYFVIYDRLDDGELFLEKSDEKFNTLKRGFPAFEKVSFDEAVKIGKERNILVRSIYTQQDEEYKDEAPIVESLNKRIQERL